MNSWHTGPLDPDTDGGGLGDAGEAEIDWTDPLDPCDDRADTDGDDLSDQAELNEGTDRNDPDTDGDGLSDLGEVVLWTDPLDTATDTDTDGPNDGAEVNVWGTQPW